ncbi:hypothetical protein J0A67_06905 [Algoriphagus aestuariicola]|uniref:Uncharacterized protein n=1 Tax=Algoriphagus aestuariicola TaxID=1852016 RepID=A0ABS3BMT8_9BACT|nr:hypothetical protein [Algoriphagus aestuariicola]MBN7800582.1 hypothetical protein [Algoriphagus aestuariicola]
MYQVTSYTIGNGSRTIIENQINLSPEQKIFIPQHLSKDELQNPLKVFSQFFKDHFPLPMARMALGDIELKAVYDVTDNFWKSKEDSILFIIQFSRLIEAAYLIRNEGYPACKVEKLSKENMIPKEILAEGNDFETIVPFLPFSHDPQDSKDPCLNLQILFYDTPMHKLLESFKGLGDLVLSDRKADMTQRWKSHLDLKIFVLILEACHLIYVRSQT